MNTQVVTVRPSDVVKKAVLKMAVDNVTGVPVVDNRNHVIGIISENDVLKLILDYQDSLGAGLEQHYLLSIPMDDENNDISVSEANKSISETKVEDIMSRNVLFTSPEADVINTLKAMMRMMVNRVPVLEKGVLVGTLSRSDIIFAIYKKKV